MVVGEMGKSTYCTFRRGIVAAEGLVMTKRLAFATLGKTGRFNVGVEAAETIEHGKGTET